MFADADSSDTMSGHEEHREVLPAWYRQFDRKNRGAEAAGERTMPRIIRGVRRVLRRAAQYCARLRATWHDTAGTLCDSLVSRR